MPKQLEVVAPPDIHLLRFAGEDDWEGRLAVKFRNAETGKIYWQTTSNLNQVVWFEEE